MEFKEIKKKSESDLHKILADSRDKLRDLRFKDANKQLKDVRAVRKTRTIIAQILTLLNVGKKTEKKIEKKETSKTTKPAKSSSGAADESLARDSKESKK